MFQGAKPARQVRFWTGKGAMAAFTVLAGVYYFKYNANVSCKNFQFKFVNFHAEISFKDWTRAKGWRVIKSRKQCVPGDEGYPMASDRSLPSDYAARGFKESPI